MDRIEQFCETLDRAYAQGEPETVEKRKVRKLARKCRRNKI